LAVRSVSGARSTAIIWLIILSQSYPEAKPAKPEMELESAMTLPFSPQNTA
jgi:hypothetical protein